VLIFGGKDMPDLVSKIDWHALMFLGGLFVVVGGLEKTGVLDDLGRGLGGIAGGNPAVLLTLLLWMSAILSMVLDNVPFAAAMVPVIRNLSVGSGIPAGTMVWPLALGMNVGGNATPIGASANVVGLAVAEKANVHVTWREYMASAAPASFVAIAVCNLILLLRFA
jgi:Na+/H+ antiporter NhaD/arsenite permease-like protein